MKRFLLFLTAALVVTLAATFALAGTAAPAVTMTGQQLATQAMAALPPWAQWGINALAALFGPALLAFIKSERLALDDSTATNGIVHYFKLARAALAVIPPMPEEPDPELKPTDLASAPEPAAAAQIAVLQAQIDQLKAGGVPNE